jgi:hypothetical protein
MVWDLLKPQECDMVTCKKCKVRFMSWMRYEILCRDCRPDEIYDFNCYKCKNTFQLERNIYDTRCGKCILAEDIYHKCDECKYVLNEGMYSTTRCQNCQINGIDFTHEGSTNKSYKTHKIFDHGCTDCQNAYDKCLEDIKSYNKNIICENCKYFKKCQDCKEIVKHEIRKRSKKIICPKCTEIGDILLHNSIITVAIAYLRDKAIKY